MASQSSRRRRIAGERRSPRQSESADPAAGVDPPMDAATAGTESVALDTDPDADTDVDSDDSEHSDAGTDTDEDHAEDPTEAATTSRAGRAGHAGHGRRRRRLVVAVLAVLTAAAVAVAGSLGYRLVQADRAETARSEALEAAQGAAADLLAYDHRTLGEDLEAGREHLTHSFAEKYEETTSSVVRPTARQTNAVVEADVQAASVVEADPDRAVVLLFVNQTTTSNQSEEPRTDRNRVRMTLQSTDEGWLVSEIDAL